MHLMDRFQDYFGENLFPHQRRQNELPAIKTQAADSLSVKPLNRRQLSGQYRLSDETLVEFRVRKSSLMAKKPNTSGI